MNPFPSGKLILNVGTMCPCVGRIELNNTNCDNYVDNGGLSCT